MKSARSVLTAGLLGFAAVACGGTQIVVDKDSPEQTSGDELSYQTIEGAVARGTELAEQGEANPVVTVKDGTYQLTGEIVLKNGVTLMSENGRDSVTLVPAANCRAVAVTKGTLAGVTIQGGTYAASKLVSDVDTTMKGLGIYLSGSSSLVSNCVVRGVVLSGSTSADGVALYNNGDGYCRDSVFTDCEGSHTILYMLPNSHLYNCEVTSNKTSSAVIHVQGGSEFKNCLVADNECPATTAAIFFNVWSWTAVDNCTVVGNAGRGMVMGSTLGFTLNNCVVALNKGGAFHVDTTKSYSLYNCAYDAETLPTNFTTVVNSMQISADDGIFANASYGDWRLAANSPLIDAGTKNTSVATDLDGRPRVNGVQDIGCYEFDSELDVPIFQVSLDRLNTPQVVSQDGQAIAFRPLVLWHGKEVAAESCSYVWDGEEKSFGADGKASETFVAGKSNDLVLKAAYGGASASKDLPKAFMCVDAASMAKTFWVGAAGSDESPYDTPEKAAHSPVDAVASALAQKNSTVFVMDGTYQFDAMITLTNGVRLVSVAEDPRRVVFSGGTEKRMFTLGNNWDKRFDGTGELSGVTIQDAQALIASDNTCRGVLIRGGCVTNCIIRNIGGSMTWQGAGNGCALNLSANWGGPGAKAVDCIIEDNASAYYKGENTDSYPRNGAAVFIGQTGFMDRCIVRNNHADDNSWGSNARIGGAGILMQHSGAVCRNTLVVGNVAVRALGGVYLDGGRLENCTIVGNAGAAEETTTYGGGLYVKSGAAVNTIVSGNLAGSAESNVALADGVDAAAVLTNCCLTAFSGGTGCLSDDPRLDASFVPTAKSPVINKGLNLAWMTAESLDLAHNPRLQRRKVDIGCYETPHAPTGFAIIIR